MTLTASPCLTDDAKDTANSMCVPLERMWPSNTVLAVIPQDELNEAGVDDQSSTRLKARGFFFGEQNHMPDLDHSCLLIAAGGEGA